MAAQSQALCDFKLSFPQALFLLTLPWLQTEASTRTLGFSRLLQGPDATPEHPSAVGSTRKPRNAKSFWEMREEKDILQMDIGYPDGHPHQRHLLEKGRTLNLGEEGTDTRYGLDPNIHNDANNDIDGNNNQNDGDSDATQSALRNSGLHEILDMEWDDDFDREILTYEHSNSVPLTDEGTAVYEPLRLQFITTPLQRRLGESAFLDQQIEEILVNALPDAAKVWSSHLSVYPALGSIQVSRNVCYNSFARDIDKTIEVSDADMVIIVSADDELSSIPVCGPRSLALGAACALDQWDRPIIGFINLCLTAEPETVELDLDDLVAQAFKSANGFEPVGRRNGTIPVPAPVAQHQGVDLTTILVHEFAHTFGFDSYLFKFFRDGATGEPLTPRPFATSTVQCTNGDLPSQVRGFPSGKVLQMGLKGNGDPYFDIVTPRVAQIAKNHFDCQSLSGARLENFESTCIGSHWDERLFLTDILSPALAWRNNLLSPLTLALLEDTGWYQVNYENVTVPSFGLGAGCDFVEKPCIQDDRVPAYASDFFCDHPIRLLEGDSFDMEEETLRKVTCDPTHQYWAMCDLWDSSTIPEFLNVRFPKGNRAASYFSDENLQVSFPQADYCPLAVEFLGVDCQDDQHPLHRHTYLGEEVGSSSRCINAFSDISEERNRRIDRPACMHIECDADQQKVVLGTGDFQQACEYDGQVLQIPSTVADFLICPRLATVCPHLFCPASCSGRGQCDYSAKPSPKCTCFDPENTSEGCYEETIDAATIVSGGRMSKQDAEVNGADGDLLDSLAVPLSSEAIRGQKTLLGWLMSAMILSMSL